MSNRVIPYLIIFLISLIVLFLCLVINNTMPREVEALPEPNVIINVEELGILYSEIEGLKNEVIGDHENLYMNDKHTILNRYIDTQVRILELKHYK